MFFSLDLRRIIDFGSAMDVFTMKHLYGSVGPSRYLFSYKPFPSPSAFALIACI